MIYITYVQPPRYHQLTFEEMMAGITVNELSELKVGTSSGTRTVCVTNVPQKLREIAANYQLNLKLALFNDKLVLCKLQLVRRRWNSDWNLFAKYLR